MSLTHNIIQKQQNSESAEHSLKKKQLEQKLLDRREILWSLQDKFKDESNVRMDKRTNLSP